MANEVNVTLWGADIGTLGYEGNQTEVATFTYSQEMAQYDIQLSPIHMLNRQAPYEFVDISQRTFKGIPGIFADSLPDKFGNQLIDVYMANKSRPKNKVTTLDRLLYVGSRSMGALEYHPQQAFEEISSDLVLDIEMLAELAEKVVNRSESLTTNLANAKERSQALSLIRVGSSAGGARSKALVATDNNKGLKDGTIDHGSDHRYWLLKFDSEDNSDRDHKDPKGMPKIEYIYAEIARQCGIDMPATDYIAVGNDFHFLIERFDRIPRGESMDKVHYASWCGLAHADRDTTGAYSYEQLIDVAKQLGLGQPELSELYRRAIFNLVGRNQDDHTKNFGFLMSRAGVWKLAPAFDMTYSYDPYGRWTNQHQIRLNLKQDDFTMADLLAFAEKCNVSRAKARATIKKTINAFETFADRARDLDVDERLRETVMHNMRLKFSP